MRTYRRRLPHLDKPGTPVFLTWRLWGSLPPERVFERERLPSGEAFVVWDRLLDTARHGPRYLGQTEIASLVRNHLIKACTDSLYTLHAFVIMPNHVHVLCTTDLALPELMWRLKGATAFFANGLLRRRGEKFWQDEFFDRIVRNDSEFNRIRRYIGMELLRACLVARPEEFPWSSAWVGERSCAPRGLKPAPHRLAGTPGMLHLAQILVDELYRDRAFPTPDATRFTDPWRTSLTANSARHAGFQQARLTLQRPTLGTFAVVHHRRAGQDEPVLVARHYAVQPVGARLRADEDKQGAGIHAFSSVGLGALDGDGFQVILSMHLGHLRLKLHVNIGRAFDFCRSCTATWCWQPATLPRTSMTTRRA